MVKWAVISFALATFVFYVLGYNLFTSTLVEDAILHDLSRVIIKEQLL